METFLVALSVIIGLSTSAQSSTIDSTYITAYNEIGISVDSLSNLELMDAVCQWHSVPYLYAGKTIDGIDCSSLVKRIYKDVYHIELLGTSSTLPNECSSVKRADLEPGDLVFFKIYNNKISHVGIYLGGSKFVHASTKRGVIVSDLTEKYYHSRYAAGGRVSILVDK
ncbi:NlpC/P60 family protein [Flavobacteriales bacterium]|nr:NlpC/P60 family protein [Flavobacteriales bacterium]